MAGAPATDEVADRVHLARFEEATARRFVRHYRILLDRLLDEERLSFEGVVATSAGAMNAAVLGYGLAEGGRKGAQAALAKAKACCAARINTASR